MVVGLLEVRLARRIVDVVLVRRVARPVAGRGHDLGHEQRLGGRFLHQDVVDLARLAAASARLVADAAGLEQPQLGTAARRRRADCDLGRAGCFHRPAGPAGRRAPVGGPSKTDSRTPRSRHSSPAAPRCTRPDRTTMQVSRSAERPLEPRPCRQAVDLEPDVAPPGRFRRHPDDAAVGVGFAGIAPEASTWTLVRIVESYRGQREIDRRAGAGAFPGRAVRRARRCTPAVLRGLLRDLRPRQRRDRRGAARASRPDAVPPGAKRAGHGPHGRRICADEESPRRARLHELDRPRRDEHGHRRRARDGQPAAGAAAARRRLRRATAPTPSCSSSRRLAPATSRSTTASGRSPATSTGCSRPEQVIPAALAAMRVLTSPAETGAVTLAFPQDVQAEAFDYPEEFLAERTWHVPRAAPEEERARPRRRGDPRGEAPADRRRRRRHLLGGDRRPARLLRRDRHPRRGDAGGQGLAPVRPSLVPGRDRRHRHASPPTGSPPEPTW